jgi:hypothetical protein
MKAKYIIAAVLILTAGFEVYRIEKRFSAVTLELTKKDRATVKVSELPEASTFDGTDLFVVADGGTVSRKLTGAKIAGAISDTADALRAEMPLAGGAGVVDTTGLPVANQFTYFTAANKIASTSNLTRASNGVISYTGVGFVFNDSAYIDYEADGFIEWVGKSKTGALFSDSLSAAGYGLTGPLPNLARLMRDTKYGEIAWQVSEDSIAYGLSNATPAQTVHALWVSAEHDKRYILSLQRQVKAQYLMILFVVVLIIALRYGKAR